MTSFDETTDLHTSPQIDYWKIIGILWKHRKFVILTVAILTIIVSGISLLIPNNYRSTAIVLPDNESSKLSGLGGLADLASMAGVSVGGGKSWIDLYPQIIESDAVLKNVIFSKYYSVEFKDSVNIIEYFKYTNENQQKNYDRAFQTLSKLLEISSDKKTKVLSVSLVLEESQLAAEIVNKILFFLEEFIRTKRLSNASERRKWIDQRLSDVKKDLSFAENNLKEFRERNRLISNSPQLLLEQQRMIREVEINSTVFIELKKQLELAKIDEINTMPIINILDKARYTTIKESPKRSLIVFVFFIIIVIAVSSYVVLVETYGETLKRWRYKFQTISGLSNAK